MKSLLISSASIIGLTALSGPAIAQTSDNENPLIQSTIYVTVQKREEALRDVPVAVTAVDSAFLEDLGLDEFDQLARFIPGFEVQEQSPNNPGFVIRGITSDSGEANIEPRIAIFQDGVSISRSRGSVVELFDVERVEVAKGPQPTLFGRGALIGGVNIVQAKPDFDFSASAALGYGNLNEIYADGHINGSLVEGKLAGRIAGRLRQRDGYVESLNPAEEDYNSQDMAAIRGSLLFTPTEDLSFTLIANWQQDEPSGTSFKSGAFAPVPGASTDAWDAAYLNTFGNFMNGQKLGLERTVQSVTLLTDWEINDYLTLSSITGWRDIDSVEVFDPDGFGLDLLIFAEDYQGEQFSQEFRLNFNDGGKFKGFIGMSYFDEEGTQYVPLTYDERAVQAFLGGAIVPPNYPPASVLPGYNITAFNLFGAVPGTEALFALKPIHNEAYTNYGDTQSIDLFADATYALSDRFEVTAGLRWTEDRKKSGLLVEYLNGPSLLTYGGLFVTESNGLMQDSGTFDDFTYRVAGTFKATENVNVFANYSRGRRPEVITASSSSPSAGFAVLDAEIVDAYELGMKGLFLGGDLSIETSAFIYDYSNFQTTFVNASGLIEPINAGDATSKGFEVQGIWAITNSIAMTANYGFNHARFDDDTSGQYPGNPLRLSPDHTASISGRFLFDLGFADLKIVPSYTWQSEVYFTNEKRADLKESAYGLLNLNAQLDFENGWGLEAYVSNALDEEYLIDAGNTGDAFGIPTFISGPPQMYGLRVSKTF